MRTRRGVIIQIAVTAAAVAAIATVGIVAAVRYQGLDHVGTAAVDTVRIGNPSARVVISATEDLQWPYCRRFEAASGPELTARPTPAPAWPRRT
jgi:protein-disulfide isomerase